MYQSLTGNELKSLLADRAIPGRSKATTKAAMIALLENADKNLSKSALSALVDHLDSEEKQATESPRKSQPAPTPAPTPQPEPEEDKRPAPSAPIPFRHRELPAATTLPSGGGQIATTRPGESRISPAQEIAQAIAQVLAPLSQEIAALRQQLAATGTSTQSPGEAFPPPGPWLNDAGELRPDFIDWIAAQWRKSFPNRATQTDWQIRGDVFKHLQKPGKLTPAWVSFENDMTERTSKAVISVGNGLLPVPHPLSGLEVVGSVSTEDKYGTFTYPVYQASNEFIAEFEAFKSRMVASTVSRMLPFSSPQSAPELAANLKSLANKFDMNSRPKSPEFSAKHYQSVARSYRARYAAAVAKSDEVEF